MISPDGNWLIGANLEATQIELRELATGKIVAVNPASKVEGITFSKDGKYAVVATGPPNSAIEMLELPSMKTLWSRPSPAPRSIAFSRDSRTVNEVTNNDSWNAYETQTGRILRQTEQNLISGCLRSADGQSTLVYQIHRAQEDVPQWIAILEHVPGVIQWLRLNEEYGFVRVFDADSGRERFRVKDPDLSVPIVLSEDGRTLVTVHEAAVINDPRVIRCWNVNAWKPLHWALGVPTGLAAMIGLFAWRRGRRGAKAA